MKYETPELTTLAPAINAIQKVRMPSKNTFQPVVDSHIGAANEQAQAYADWE